MRIQRTFTPEDQIAFAGLSGDHNPLHVDPLLARRLMFGGPVVHGAHAVLWSLDRFSESRRDSLRLQSLKVVFQAGIPVGEPVACAYEAPDGREVEIRLETDTAPAAWIHVAWRPTRGQQAAALPSTPDGSTACLERTIEEAAAASASLPLYLDMETAQAMFPNLLRVLPPIQVAALLAVSRLVGMECPGRHSIFSGMDLTFSADFSGEPVITYRVADSNKRLSLLKIAVDAPGMDGNLKAFVRPAPRSQAAYRQMRSDVDSEEFSDQRALVAGGSRGLGEITAKLLAAGGAEVVLTYYRGEEEARRIVEELVSAGARADCLPLNVLEPSEDLLGKLAGGAAPLCLYYFATPFIFGGVRGKFAPRRFETFCNYYVTGFLRTVQSLAPPRGGLRKIFYPSTEAIDKMPPDMGEYAAAKSAGERLCDFLQKTHPGLIIHRPRLPRLATDQTVSLLPVHNQDPVPVLLGHLRHLRQLQLAVPEIHSEMHTGKSIV